MLVPLLGFVRGDTLGLLVLVQDTDTVAELARSAMAAAAVRVPMARSARVFRQGTLLALDDTVGRLGLQPLERIDIVPQVGIDSSEVS